MSVMMELTVKPVGQGVQFVAEARGHSVLCDQPESNGGQDAGMTPPEFLLASLGTCAGFYALQYLRARNLSTAELAVKVLAEKATQPARLGSFRIEVTLPPGLEARHQEGVQRAVEKCLIHNTLLHPPSIEIALVADQVPAEPVAG